MQSRYRWPMTAYMKHYTKLVIGLTLVLGLVWLTSAGAALPSKSDHADGTAPGQSTNNGSNGNQGTTGPHQSPAPQNGSGTTGPPSGVPGGAAPEPEHGATVTVQPGTGVVMITLPGTANAVPLTGDDPIPVGAKIDARHGAVTLTSAVDSNGATQTGTFWGGMFTVTQSRTPGAYTELDLVGGRPSDCSRAKRASVARRRSHSGAKLWGHDNHGHFRTRGQNSVATVRGTRWLTLETCKGTLTHVAQGAVSVRDLHAHKTVLVRAHHSYVAHSRRAS
jgi:hypothetical protein